MSQRGQDSPRKKPASTSAKKAAGSPAKTSTNAAKKADGTPAKKASRPAAKRSDGASSIAGVRGPQGPAQPPAASGGLPRNLRSTGSISPARARLESLSAGPLSTLHRLPRWIMVVAPGLFLFGGLVAVGPWAALGAMLLLLVGAFLGWLLALAWPRLSGGSRMLRLIIIVAILGLAFFKATGRF